jgi:hypothetical protein
VPSDSVRSVAYGLASLELAGVLNSLRHCVAGRDDQGRFGIERDTNACAVLPSLQWLAFVGPSEALVRLNKRRTNGARRIITISRQ